MRTAGTAGTGARAGRVAGWAVTPGDAEALAAGGAGSPACGSMAGPGPEGPASTGTGGRRAWTVTAFKAVRLFGAAATTVAGGAGITGSPWASTTVGPS